MNIDSLTLALACFALVCLIVIVRQHRCVCALRERNDRQARVIEHNFGAASVVKKASETRTQERPTLGSKSRSRINGGDGGQWGFIRPGYED